MHDPYFYLYQWIFRGCKTFTVLQSHKRNSFFKRTIQSKNLSHLKTTLIHILNRQLVFLFFLSNFSIIEVANSEQCGCGPSCWSYRYSNSPLSRKLFSIYFYTFLVQDSTSIIPFKLFFLWETNKTKMKRLYSETFLW